MDKKISSSTAAGIIAGAVVILGIVGYMTFMRGSGQAEKLTATQQTHDQVMKMSPEERRKFGEQAFAAQMQANNGQPR